MGGGGRGGQYVVWAGELFIYLPFLNFFFNFK